MRSVVKLADEQEFVLFGWQLAFLMYVILVQLVPVIARIAPFCADWSVLQLMSFN